MSRIGKLIRLDEIPAPHFGWVYTQLAGVVLGLEDEANKGKAFTPIAVNADKSTNTGVYANVAWDVSDRTTLSVEARYQDDDVTNENKNTGDKFNNVTTSFSPRLAFTHAVNDNWSAYGQFSNGTNPAGVSIDFVREVIVDSLAAARAGGYVTYDANTFKVFEEEREMTVMLLIDVSASGNFGTSKQFKRELATELAAILAFSAIKNNDKVGVIFFSDRIEQFIPPKKGKSHILRIIREVLAFKPIGKGTDIAGALEYFNSVIKKRSICFILSDFMSKPFDKPLKIASKKHDVIALRIHDKREDNLPNVGLVPMQDAETEEMIFVDTASKKLRDLFTKNRASRITTLKKLFPTCGVDLIDITTGVDYVRPLINFFKTRIKRR